ncbi:Eukaryotic translation initiation factor 4E type 2 [Hypsizygus marmoreus]|uniref:Eukaryotic translation initiation factor 4E type 2 n=1 Tax=Hypsizygus marmoreus TaxID=39966 RepID=A0A369KCW9_HYPMA|nr:Eukaryotic translation initiation factor 4E type 2 [Hypsizygus marmoreus]
MTSSTAPSTDVPVPAPAPTTKPRLPLPSLNQLAARINVKDNKELNPNTTSAPRPRLAAFALRTGSNASLSTVASTTDSITANPSLTRSTSPSGLSTSDEAGDGLTSEKLEKLNQETTTAAAPLPEKRGVKVGYKNIPSLDAITARLAKARALSIDGSAKPPEPEMIEDPKTPGVPMQAPEHPLQYPWTIYHDSKSKYPFTPATATVPDTNFAAPAPPESTDYEAGLTVIGEFDTVESFCRYFNWLKPPSKLERNSNYHLFKSGIKPMWEDEANANGGKWVLTMKNNPVLLDRCWSWLAMALVGQELEDGDEICGAVVSLRSKVDRIQVWMRGKEDVEKLNAVGKKLVKLLDVSEADGIGLEFQVGFLKYNTDDRPLPNKFLSIQSVPNSSFRSSFQPNSGGAAPPSGHGHTKSVGGTEGSGPASAGAFGSFGVGGIGAWKAKRG